MRILGRLLPACLVLSACNMAISERPMFAAEPKAALKLKDGLWAAEDAKCKYSTASRTDRWPNCALWLILAGGSITGGKDADPGDLPLVLTIAEGRPPILEFPVKDRGDTLPNSFVYLALEPVGFDSAGAAVDLQIWFIACGVDEGSKATGMKIRQFPGMDKDCHPASVDALRSAAAEGLPQGSSKQRWRWIRASAN